MADQMTNKEESMNPSRKLTELLKMPEKNIYGYLCQVQEYFQNPPPQELIADFILQFRINVLPHPYDLARSIVIKNHHPGPLNKKPYFGKNDIPDRQRRSGSTYTGLIFESHLDRSRLPPEEQKGCRHGVAFGKECAICDPARFREMTGID
jgi:hypothetical protein